MDRGERRVGRGGERGQGKEEPAEKRGAGRRKREVEEGEDGGRVRTEGAGWWGSLLESPYC